MNLFPNTNFHSLNLDWILSQIRKAVYSVNGQAPDANGNVNLATVAGVTAVNGVGPDGQGNVQLTPSNVGALPVSYQAPVMSVNQKTGYVMLTPADVGALPANYQAPVDSVNGQTGAVVLDASDVGAIPDTYVAPVTSVNNKTGDVILDAADVGALADTTVIPDRTSQLINDSGFLTAQQAGAVTSVNNKVGAVVLGASDVGALPDTTVVPTLTSQLVNDSGFITSAQASPVQSVNSKVGNVVLDATDVGAAPAAAGIPQGGASGSVLTKNSGNDYDTGWKSLRTIIWTNQNPSLQFAAQTINNVDLSGFTWFLAEFRLLNSSDSVRVSVLASIGSVTAVTSNTPYQNKLRQFERDMTLNSDSIVFGNATSTTEGANTAQANTLLIPLQIIGLL